MGQSQSRQACEDRRDGPLLDRASGPSEHTMSPILAIGGGCFWGVEHYMTRYFQNRFPGSIKIHQVGFMSPNPETAMKNPTYQQVCTGKSRHVEVLWVELKDPQLHFEDFCRFFFSIHDPTTENRQGTDRGSQYQSIVFCSDEIQEAIVRQVMRELQGLLDRGAIRCFARKRLLTKIAKISRFTAATERHQEYLSKNPTGYW